MLYDRLWSSLNHIAIAIFPANHREYMIFPPIDPFRMSDLLECPNIANGIDHTIRYRRS